MVERVALMELGRCVVVSKVRRTGMQGIRQVVQHTSSPCLQELENRLLARARGVLK